MTSRATLLEEDGAVLALSPAGWIAVCAGLRGVTRIALCSRKADLFAQISQAERGNLQLAHEAMDQILSYFDGKRRRFDLPFDMEGLSSFAVDVLAALQKVSCGSVVTYGELAVKAGHPGAGRAVGRVMALNRYPILVPCHRVVGGGGSLTGYSAGDGLATKEWLLRFELERGRD